MSDMDTSNPSLGNEVSHNLGAYLVSLYISSSHGVSRHLTVYLIISLCISLYIYSLSLDSISSSSSRLG
jgi:hypothetical protein